MAFAIVLGLSGTVASAAQAPAAPRKQAVARHVTEGPVIDGVLDELVWRQAVPITDFVQAEPSEGQPAGG